MNRSSLLISICLTAIAAASCSGSSQSPNLGGLCTLDSDCTNPLVCKFATCHQQCAESRDCPTGQHCVTVGNTGVCQTPAEATCGTAHACSAPLVCRSDDGTCRNVCTSSGTCAGTGQTCVGTYCLDSTEIAKNDGSAGAGDGAPGSDMGSAGASGGTSGPDAGSEGVADGGTAVGADANPGSDAPATGVDAPATGMDALAAGVDAPGSDTRANSADAPAGGSGGSGGSTGDGGPPAAGASGNTCTPGNAPTNFGNVATSDSNPNYTSGVGLLTATEFLTFNGYVGPDSNDGGAGALVNRIDVQHFDPITGKSKGSATPLLATGGDGTGLYINGADIAPTGEIAIIYSVQGNSVWGMFLTFLDKNLAPKKTTQFLAWGSAYPVSSHVKWLNGEFVASSMVYNPGLNATIKLGKFGADGSNAGNINALPTDDPSNGAHDACLADGNEGEGEVAFSGGLFAVGYLSLAKITPYLTILDASGAAVGSPISLQSTNPDTRLISMAGTLNGFVTIYNGHSSSGAWALLATYVSNSASGSISASGDAGVPLGATYAFPGSGAVGSGGGGGCSDGQTCGSSDGTGAGFAVLYPNGSVSFLYFGEDGSPRGQEQTVLYELKAYDADKVQVTNFGGTFAVSLYSYATHSTQVIASTCR